MADFDRPHQTYVQRVMNKHKIDKAIRQAKGLRKFDPAIRRMWERVLKKSKKRDETKNRTRSGLLNVR